MPTRRPSLRRDLQVRPIQRRGRRFIELSDPARGTRLCLSDLGYSVAFLMDGADVDELIVRARSALHIELSEKRLAKFAERLATFGMLVGSRPAAEVAATRIDARPPYHDGNRTLRLSRPELDALLKDAVGRGAVPTGFQPPIIGAAVTTDAATDRRNRARVGQGGTRPNLRPAPVGLAARRPAAPAASDGASEVGEPTASRRPRWP